MAHEAEYVSVAIPRVLATAFRANVSQPYTCLASGSWTSPSPNRTAAVGTLVRGRAASVHKPKDIFGWREPSAYWGYNFVTGAAGLTGYGYRFRNPSNGSNVYRNETPTLAYKTLPSGITLSTYRPNFPSLQSIAITECLAELGSATAELGVELREARKTATFLGDKLRTFAHWAKDVRNFRVPKAWRKFRRADKVSWASKSLSDRWLEYRYAWSPLVMGVNDSLALLEKQAMRPFLMTARKRQETVTDSVSTVSTYHGAYYTFPVYATTEVEETKSCYVVLTMQIKSHIMTTLNDAGVLNLAGVWWETVPFSFVADWFVNVGDYLNAFSALSALELKGGTATHRHVWTTRVTEVGYSNVSHVPCGVGFQDVAAAGGSSFNRVVLYSGDLIPTLHLQNGLNLKRALDAVTLINSLLRGKKIGGLRV